MSPLPSPLTAANILKRIFKFDKPEGQFDTFLSRAKSNNPEPPTYTARRISDHELAPSKLADDAELYKERKEREACGDYSLSGGAYMGPGAMVGPPGMPGMMYAGVGGGDCGGGGGGVVEREDLPDPEPPAATYSRDVSAHNAPQARAGLVSARQDVCLARLYHAHMRYVVHPWPSKTRGAQRTVEGRR